VCASTVVLPRFCRVFTHLCICLPVMATERVTSVISSFQRWLIASPIVPASTYGSATIDANGFVYKLFLAFRFSDTDVGCQFLTQLGLLRVPYCAVSARTKCLGASPIIVTTVSDGHVGGSRLLRHVLLSQQSGTDHGFRRVTSFMEVNFLTYNNVRRANSHTVQQESQFGSATISNWAKFCRETMFNYVQGGSQKIVGLNKTVEIDASSVGGNTI